LGYALQQNEEVKIIESYTKILHIVNEAQDHIAQTLILKNIDQLNLSISDPLKTMTIKHIILAYFLIAHGTGKEED